VDPVAHLSFGHIVRPFSSRPPPPSFFALRHSLQCIRLFFTLLAFFLPPHCRPSRSYFSCHGRLSSYYHIYHSLVWGGSAGCYRRRAPGSCCRHAPYLMALYHLLLESPPLTCWLLPHPSPAS
jgi:hypothetical protein